VRNVANARVENTFDPKSCCFAMTPSFIFVCYGPDEKATCNKFTIMSINFIIKSFFYWHLYYYLRYCLLRRCLGEN
jgi:hypothetical protein